MTQKKPIKDLLFLVTDKDMHQAIEGILSRPQALAIRPVSFDIWVHPQRDAGCRTEAAAMLRPQCRRYQQALVMFDHHGSGAEANNRESVEQEMEEELGQNGWSNRAAAVVPSPELEAWIWSTSPVVEQVLGWQGKSPPLRDWLEQQGFLTGEATKPPDPKGAMNSAVRKVAKQPSPAIFKQLARQVSFQKCQDPAFLKLKSVMQRVFPREQT